MSFQNIQIENSINQEEVFLKIQIEDSGGDLLSHLHDHLP